MRKKPAVIIHYGAGVWTAKVRAEDGEYVTFDLRAMPRKDPKAKMDQHRFRVQLVKAFREAGLQRAA